LETEIDGFQPETLDNTPFGTIHKDSQLEKLKSEEGSVEIQKVKKVYAYKQKTGRPAKDYSTSAK